MGMSARLSRPGVNDCIAVYVRVSKPEPEVPEGARGKVMRWSCGQPPLLGLSHPETCQCAGVWPTAQEAIILIIQIINK